MGVWIIGAFLTGVTCKFWRDQIISLDDFSNYRSSNYMSLTLVWFSLFLWREAAALQITQSHTQVKKCQSLEI